MESKNLLAHHVNAGGPVAVVVVISIVAVAQSGNIVAQSIHPHIHGVLGIKGNRNAPGHSGAGNAGVLQALLDEGDHLVAAAGRLNEIGVVLIILQQAIGIFAGFKEVSFLVRLIYRAVAVGAAAVFVQLAVGPKAFAGLAVMAGIFALVNVTLLIKLGEDLLAGFNVVIVGGAHKAIIADIHQLPQILYGGHDFVHILLGGHALGGSFVLNFLAVLVSAGQKHHIIALHPLKAGQCIAGHGGVAVADVQLVAGVVNGSGNVKFLIHIRYFLSYKMPRMKRHPESE